MDARISFADNASSSPIRGREDTGGLSAFAAGSVAFLLNVTASIGLDVVALSDLIRLGSEAGSALATMGFQVKCEGTSTFACEALVGRSGSRGTMRLDTGSYSKLEVLRLTESHSDLFVLFV